MTRSDADRNLLFGILALHNGFITRDALVRAMSSWIAEKPTPLGQILVRNGDLAPDHHSLMDVLVQAHLKQHRGDAAQSLAAVNTTALAKVLLHELPDADVRATLIPSEPETGVTRIEDEDADGEADRGGRRHPDVVRPAVPHPPAHAGGPGRGLRRPRRGAAPRGRPQADPAPSRRRGQPLPVPRRGRDHRRPGAPRHRPGLRPGLDADGRPFYAMRFIRGDSLKEAIDAVPQPAAAGRPTRARGRSRCASCCAGSSTSATRSPTPTAGACSTAT